MSAFPSIIDIITLMKDVKKWVAISGSWRKTNKKIEDDVRKTVRKVLSSRKGIIVGGALSVDYFATDEAIKNDPSCRSLKIYLPTTLAIYVKHNRKRAREGLFTNKQAEDLIKQLNHVKIKNTSSIIENKQNKTVSPEEYYERNSEIVNASDELIAFHVNNSAGVQNTIDKAKSAGMVVKVYSYIIK